MSPRLLSCALLAVIAGCGREAVAPAPRVARVFAAASLTAVFTSLAAAFEKEHPDTKLDLHFAGTPSLVMQVQQGERPAVFASADEANMQKLVDARVLVGDPRIFASNGLAIVVRPGNPASIHRLADLATPGLKVALCGPEVPAGRYARQALGKAGVAVSSVSDEPNVKALVTKVQLGELDAGIVYRTDGHGLDGKVTLVDVAPEHDVVAKYPIAGTIDAYGADVGARFVQFVFSPVGQNILQSFGFRAR
ncbi:MAG: molybdate ABC transporter substrate-binding protein [Planctomycetes bacterium]|nr:molybdate ABC transporter substrate-binding protein [Planctomycetota bacterium]